MASGEQEHLVKVRCGDGGDFAYVLTKVSAKALNLLIIIRDRSYKVELSYNELETQAEKLKIETLSDWAFECFTKQESNSEYMILFEKDIMEWKKATHSKRGVRISLGRFPAEEADFIESQSHLLNTSIDQLSRMSSRDADLSRKHETLVEQVKESSEKMNELIQHKDNLESEMIARFLPILHSKQDKIKSLQQQLISIEAPGDASDNENQGYDSNTDVEESNDTVEPVAKMAKTGQDLDDSQNILNV